MEATITQLDDMIVVGYQSLIIMPNHNLIPYMWERFIPQEHRIKHIAQEHVGFGVTFDIELVETEVDGEKKTEHRFFHLVGLPVSSTKDIPEGMTYKKVPAHRYAKFTHKGPLSKLDETYGYIYSQWLPNSEYEYDEDACEIEWYDERFDKNSDNSEYDIYVPIK